MYAQIHRTEYIESGIKLKRLNIILGSRKKNIFVIVDHSIMVFNNGIVSRWGGCNL